EGTRPPSGVCNGTGRGAGAGRRGPATGAVQLRRNSGPPTSDPRPSRRGGRLISAGGSPLAVARPKSCGRGRLRIVGPGGSPQATAPRPKRDGAHALRAAGRAASSLRSGDLRSFVYPRRLPAV